MPAKETVYSLDDLKQYDSNPPDLALYRKKSTLAAYTDFKAEFVEKGTTLSEHILKKVLEEDKKFMFSINKFPYNIKDNVVHLVIWVNPLWIVSEKEIRNFIEKKLNIPSSGYVMFENNDKSKSIPSIQHYQLFINFEYFSRFQLIDL